MVKNNSQSSDEDEPTYDADLIAFDKIGNIFCKGHCNVKRIIKKKSLRVKLYQEEFAPFLAPMKMMGYTYYMKNNIIFVFAGSRENDDFALVFCSVEHCKDVYDRYFPEPPKPEDPTMKKKKKPIMKNVTDKLNHRFLIPICRAIVANSKLPEKKKNPKLALIFKDWLENFSEKTKGPFIDVAMENDAYYILYPDENRMVVTKEAMVSPKKKKHSDGKDGSGVKASAVSEKSKKTKSPKNDENGASVSRKNKQSDNEIKQRPLKQNYSLTKDDTESGIPGKKSKNDETPKSVKQRPQKPNHSVTEDDTKAGNSNNQLKHDETPKSVKQRPRKQNHSVTEDSENSNNKSKHDETPKGVKQRPRKQKRGDGESDSENEVSPVPAKKVKPSVADKIISTFAELKDGTDLVDKMVAIVDDDEDGDDDVHSF